MNIVECVPNVSEGRDLPTIKAIESALRSVQGVKILHVDSGLDANRTVFTFAGPPEAVLEGAFALTKKATELIDMRKHEGAHPRIGATDVVPFIPLGEQTMEDCIALSKRFGERVWSELSIPVYYYEETAISGARRNLSDIRKGEYQSLPMKLLHPEWRPDVGGSAFNERSGAIVVGARKVLIAFNVNLSTRDEKIAAAIAARIRTRGPISDRAVRLPACRAIGWDMPRLGCAQVSMNLFDYLQTSPFDAYQACSREAEKLGVRVTGSELVGLIPLDALLLSARQAGASGSEDELLSQAITLLGLSQFNTFKPRARIIEYLLAAS